MTNKNKKFAAFRELVNSSLMSGWLTAHNYNCTNALGRPLSQKEMDVLETSGTQAVLLHFVNFLRDPRGQELMKALEVEMPDEVETYIQSLLEGEASKPAPEKKLILPGDKKD
jgi:hypothetical protein